jgi:hypothetical protein
MNQQLIVPAAAAGTFTIGGDLRVNRMGYGAMRITGPEFGDLLPINKRRSQRFGKRSN